MEDKIIAGDLVFLTEEYEKYWQKKHKKKIRYVNRLAKVEKIIDWDSEEGKLLKRLRKKSGKWEDLPIEDNKYILSIFYHEIKGRSGEKGVAERGVPFFSCNPFNKKPFFKKIPDWIYQEILKKCEDFEIEEKEEDGVS